MSSAAYSVTVVVDRKYGEKLLTIVEAGPVWIVDTPVNRAAAEIAWNDPALATHPDGLTTFLAADHRTGEELFLDILWTVDLHHGVYSHDPAYTVLTAVGTPLTATIRRALIECGFDTFVGTEAGFRASRPLEVASFMPERENLPEQP